MGRRSWTVVKNFQLPSYCSGTVRISHPCCVGGAMQWTCTTVTCEPSDGSVVVVVKHRLASFKWLPQSNEGTVLSPKHHPPKSESPFTKHAGEMLTTRIQYFFTSGGSVARSALLFNFQFFNSRISNLDTVRKRARGFRPVGGGYGVRSPTSVLFHLTLEYSISAAQKLNSTRL